MVINGNGFLMTEVYSVFKSIKSLFQEEVNNKFMIMINGNWERVKNLSDILEIVSENISSEFAQKVEEIFKDNEYKIEELENKIAELEVKIIGRD